MATIIFGAVGFAAGASIGGTVLGLSAAVVGKAIGATLGQLIDQRLLGAGSQRVETGQVERFRLTGASEGASVPKTYGRTRIGGEVIWATRFQESKSTTGGGKGTSTPTTVSYSYSVSAAVALCEGEITRIGRIWADGNEVARDDLNLRLYTGAKDQVPDPKIEAIEGMGNAPAYRGIAYVVFEDLQLAPFGNRFPQFSFEVMRPAQLGVLDAVTDPVHAVQAVAMIPGTGEYALATSPVHFATGLGENRSANVNTPSGKTDFVTSVEALREELPQCKSVSLVVSWFGDDLRADRCALQPKVEQVTVEGQGMVWSVSGISRGSAMTVPMLDGRSIYGGTPADASVIEAITHLNDGGQKVVFYPFILMEQLQGNGLDDPWNPGQDQPHLPWRGRITLSVAPGQTGSVDQTAAADAEVAAFFGTAAVGDFNPTVNGVGYSGPAEFSYRRFILHYAHLCVAAGGVDAFCIGSEMRGLSQIRGANGFPAVAAMQSLAADVRQILGPDVKISYAADWSEYFGYHPQDGTGDVYFHLDPLWADTNVDFIGIDNYMPLSDWRAGDDHLDADQGAIYDLDYLTGNVAGGEGYDWYYHSPEAEAAQIRSPITDGAHGEPWVFRYKDLLGWWQNEHHERIGGVRQSSPTAWQPQSKPFWFTEFGCAAVNKATNQPNRFLDPKSSESGLPKYSDGRRDDLIQMQYLRAVYTYWDAIANNPVSEVYGAPMLDISRAHVWAWDARPYPFFPNNQEVWGDGANYARGHWLTGRASSRSLASVVAEICQQSAIADFDVSALYGYVRGYQTDQVASGRAALQPLMLAYGFDAIDRDGVLVFKMRDGRIRLVLDPDQLALTEEQDSVLAHIRAPEAEVSGRVRLTYIEADGDYEVRTSEAIFPDENSAGVAQSEIALALSQVEATSVVERWLAESRVARDLVQFALPPSDIALGAGDVVALPDASGQSLFRIDHVEEFGARLIEATRVEPGVYTPGDLEDVLGDMAGFIAPVPVFPLFLDLPLLLGDEVEHAPHLAVTATPWPGSVALYGSATDSAYVLNRVIENTSIVGLTETVLEAADPARMDRNLPLRVKVYGGGLSSVSWDEVLNGANAAVIGDGSSDNWEVFQFSDAVLVGEDTYDLSNRLRGQMGSDGIMPDSWPTGSLFVLLDGNQQQIDLAASSRDLARHYRIGPAGRGYDDPSYVHLVEAFRGIGLRPYRPAHLQAAYDSAGDLQVLWIRRSRIDGDNWSSVEVPLGEASESYHLRVMQGGALVRESILGSASWTYSQAEKTSDGLSGSYAIEVAQLSERFGAGPFKRIEIDG